MERHAADGNGPNQTHTDHKRIAAWICGAGALTTAISVPLN